MKFVPKTKRKEKDIVIFSYSHLNPYPPSLFLLEKLKNKLITYLNNKYKKGCNESRKIHRPLMWLRPNLQNTRSFSVF